MSKVIKRSQLNRPLTCAEYDANLDATLDRANHTGVQSATTIYDLYETVDGYDFILALKKCCQELWDALDQLRDDLFGEGELAAIIERLRQELLALIYELTQDLESLRQELNNLKITVTNLTTLINNLNLAIQDIYDILSRVLLFGGNSTVDYNLATGTDTFNQGVYYFKNFTIGPSATLTIASAARIYCSGEVNINGNIVVTPIPGSGGGGTGFQLYGGTSRDIETGKGYGGGGRTNGGPSYNYYLQLGGSGGAAGSATSYSIGINDGGIIGAGGNGGGYIVIEAAKNISITGNITANGGHAVPSTVQEGNPAIAGSGGGSGGLIWLQSLETITYQGTASVRGGNGTDAIGSASGIQGGGGGGGGYIVMTAPHVAAGDMTANLQGGAFGAKSAGFDTYAGGGGGGYGGVGGRSSSENGHVGQLIIRNIRPAA